MKRAKKLISIVLIISLLSGCSKKGQDSEPSAKNVKKKIIRLSHCHQADFSSETHMAAWVFQKWVNDNCETLEVKIYASNMLGHEREVYEGIQLGGGASCIISGTAILNNFNRKIAVLDLPYIWKDYEHVHKALDGQVGRILADELQNHGFKVLAWMDSWGYRNVVTSKKKVETPEDLKGLKIRTIQTPIYLETLNAMGANATPMAMGEIYSSLQTGVLDGFEHGAAVIRADKFYEVAKHIALTRHLFGPLVLVYSKTEWDKLTDDEKKVVQEAAIMARDIQRALGPVREAEAFEFLKSKGMTIHQIDTTGFRQKAIQLQNKLARQNGATNLLEMIRSLE